MAAILKYNKITIYHAIYIKLFYGGTIYYITVSTDDFLNNTNNETEFPEQKIFFEEHFDMKVQEVYFLKYPSFRIFQSPLSFSVD